LLAAYPTPTLEVTVDQNTLIGLVALAVFLLLVGGGIWLFLFLRARERKRIEAMSPEERELHEANLEYNATLKEAQKSLRDHQKVYDAGVAGATRAVKEAEGIGNRTIASYRGRDGNVAATELAVTFNNQSFYIDGSFRAAADTAGNLATSSRTTLTRVAAGGLIFGPAGAIVGAVAKKNKVVDTRELYLLVESSAFSGVITCNPDDGPRVRQVAAAINNAARNFEQVRAYREHSIATAHGQLEQAKLDTAGVQEATKYLEWAQTNLGRREAASRALDSARARMALEAGTAQAPESPS
jgi:hypothetical protein